MPRLLDDVVKGSNMRSLESNRRKNNRWRIRRLLPLPLRPVFLTLWIVSISVAVHGQITKWEPGGALGILPPARIDRSSIVPQIREELAGSRVAGAQRLAEMLLRKEPWNYEGYFWLGFTEFAEG